MLGNRVTRLITTVLLCIATILVYTFLFGDVANLTGSVLLLMACYAIGLVYQICADFLNFGFLDNLVGRLIKRIIFFAIVALALLICTVMHFTDTVAGEYNLIEKYGLFARALVVSGFFAPVVTTLFCTIQDQVFCEQERVPFIPLASMIGSFILGIITSLTGLYTFLPIILLIVGIVAIVLLMRANGVIFDESYGSGYSGGSSSGSSGYSGNRNNLNNNYNDNDDDDKPDPDNRKNDGFILNEMSRKMNSIASSHSRYISLSRGAYLSLNVRASSGAGSVTFYVNSTLEIDRSYIEHESDVRQIENEARSELSNQMRDIKNDAEREISYLRSEYRDYDGRISIRVSPSDTRIQIR